MNKTQRDYDLIIVGGGSGGYAAARTAASLGKGVAVVENGKRVGGLCILRGCMPTKTLLYAAEVTHLAREASVWGINILTVEPDWEKVMARKNQLIDEFASYREQQLNDGRFTFIRDSASFLDPHTVQLASNGTLTAEHFVVATGSQVSPPPLPALANTGYLTSDDALNLPRQPSSLIVLGGGAVAVELAQFFQRMGTQVTLVQRGSNLLKEFDPEVAKEIEAALRAEGMEIYTGTRLIDACPTRAGKQIRFIHEGKPCAVEAEHILMALGRSPNTSGLNLDGIGVDIDTRSGRILCNQTMQTTVPNVYAAGDCTGPHDVVHVAIAQGEAAAQNICHPELRHSIDDRLLTSIVFTDPQVGQTGLTEREAKSRRIPYRTASYPFNDHGKSMIMNSQFGFVRLLADERSGEILGGTCVGPVGGELIHEITVAMSARMTVHQLAKVPHYHPTLAEIWSYPAEELAEEISESKG